MGGDRHHPLVVALAEGLAGRRRRRAAPRPARPERPAAAAHAAVGGRRRSRAEVGVERLLLVGYSWGSAVVALTTVDGLAARVLVAPPVTMLDLPPQPEPTLVLVPAHDQYGPPAEVEAALSAWPDATIEVVDGCDHFLAGAIGAHHRSRRRLAHD